jgi:hypothetical protein
MWADATTDDVAQPQTVMHEHCWTLHIQSAVPSHETTVHRTACGAINTSTTKAMYPHHQHWWAAACTDSGILAPRPAAAVFVDGAGIAFDAAGAAFGRLVTSRSAAAAAWPFRVPRPNAVADDASGADAEPFAAAASTASTSSCPLAASCWKAASSSFSKFCPLCCASCCTR